MSQNKRYIPLNAGESAVLPDANTLLPRNEVYEPLAQMIIDAVKKTKAAKGKLLNELREHNAISIDGARGTGKTAVLVNLKSYLKDQDVLKDVHILDPVDPTLLEDGDSLFLHIMVAAVLHDKDVKEAQRREPNKARNLNQVLEKLAQSLESVETQKDRHGMDKVRAMYSNKQLADCVQDFFHEVLGLLEKKLLILPIDDVDTSLNRAFENLEIVRRYLATPYVLPIVCGDRELYNDVTWRDFHGRLIKDSSYHDEEAYKRAVELAAEYQRKILPFPRRLTMPQVSKYWQQNENIYLRDEQQAEVMPLRNFISWLEIFLTGPVNGSEGSRLPLPIPSIRALSQLVRHCQDLIPELPGAIRTAKNELEVRRIWQMATTSLADMAAFHSKHQFLGKSKKPDYAEAYKEFSEKVKNSPTVHYTYGNSRQGDESRDWIKRNDLPQKLADYFCFEPKGGAAYLILLAKLHWQNWSGVHSSARRHSILDTPLFQPLAHASAKFERFDKADDLSAWSALLDKRLPGEWLAGIKSQKTILPYPVAEIGVNSSKEWYEKTIHKLEIDEQDVDKKNKAIFLISLMAQHNFYTNAKQTILLNIGRVFELLIASICGPLSVEDINEILSRAPFFSTAALAPTKTITIDEKDGKPTSAADEGAEEAQDEEHDVILMVEKLHQEIEEWRHKYNFDQIELSPWLVYKVFNKVFSQVASSEKVSTGMKDIGRALNMAAHTFYATWFAFGSFEKGELFGLSNVVATTNINPENLKNYEQHDQFKVNILPFSPTPNQLANKDDYFEQKSTFGQQARVVSHVLAEHPLKQWIDEVIKLKWPKEESVAVNKNQKNSSRNTSKAWLCQKLNISPLPKSLTLKRISTALKDKNHQECNNLLTDGISIYSGTDRTISNLKKAIDDKFPEQP